MKRKAIVLFAAAAAVALLAGCDFLFPLVRGSGSLTTSSYGLSGYNRVMASQAFTVHVVPDASYSVQVTCDDNIVPYLVVRQNGTALEVGLEQGYNYQGVTASAEVHMPAVTSVDVSGASRATVEPGFSSALPLNLMVSGASVVTLKGVSCGALTADISGASLVTAVGTAGAETLLVSGASTADLRGCTGTSASAYVSGASQAYVNVGSGALSYSVSGASTLYYAGTPALQRRDLSGGSRLVAIQ